MLKQICHNGWLPVVILFGLGTMSVTEYIKFLIGNDETVLIFIQLIVFSFVISFFQFTKQYYKYLVVVHILFIAFLFLILGYSSLPEQKIQRARAHFRQVENSNLSEIKKDNLYSLRVNYIQREQKARQLELEAAKLRYYGPKEYYGLDVWEYFLFFSGIGVLIIYALFWLIHLSRNKS